MDDRVSVQGKLIAVNDETGVQIFRNGECAYFQTPGQPFATGPVPVAQVYEMLDELGFRRATVADLAEPKEAPDAR